MLKQNYKDELADTAVMRLLQMSNSAKQSNRFTLCSRISRFRKWLINCFYLWIPSICGVVFTLLILYLDKIFLDNAELLSSIDEKYFVAILAVAILLCVTTPMVMQFTVQLKASWLGRGRVSSYGSCVFPLNMSRLSIFLILLAGTVLFVVQKNLSSTIAVFLLTLILAEMLSNCLDKSRASCESTDDVMAAVGDLIASIGEGNVSHGSLVENALALDSALSKDIFLRRWCNYSFASVELRMMIIAYIDSIAHSYIGMAFSGGEMRFSGFRKHDWGLRCSVLAEQADSIFNASYSWFDLKFFPKYRQVDTNRIQWKLDQIKKKNPNQLVDELGEFLFLLRRHLQVECGRC